MENEIRSKVIKPPAEMLSSKVFRPDSKLLTKMWSEFIIVAITLWGGYYCNLDTHTHSSIHR